MKAISGYMPKQSEESALDENESSCDLIIKNVPILRYGSVFDCSNHKALAASSPDSSDCLDISTTYTSCRWSRMATSKGSAFFFSLTNVCSPYKLNPTMRENPLQLMRGAFLAVIYEGLFHIQLAQQAVFTRRKLWQKCRQQQSMYDGLLS